MKITKIRQQYSSLLWIKNNMSDLLKDKIALISGASRGIGRGIAVQFAKEGANIAFTDRNFDSVTQELIDEITTYGVQVKAYESDARDFDSCHNVVKQVVEDFGGLDILVNNAGITRDGLMLRMSEENWDTVIESNLKSAFNFVHAVTPVMIRKKAGSIINISSIVGISGNAAQANYSASKAGLIALSKSMAKELGSRGIRSNCIAPGYILTDMTKSIPTQMKEQWIQQIPLRRAGTVEDVAKVALFLASDMSSYVSGQVLNVCGAMS